MGDDPAEAYLYVAGVRLKDVRDVPLADLWAAVRGAEREGDDTVMWMLRAEINRREPFGDRVGGSWTPG